jgi:hypothetical protein
VIAEKVGLVELELVRMYTYSDIAYTLGTEFLTPYEFCNSAPLALRCSQAVLPWGIVGGAVALAVET